MFGLENIFALLAPHDCLNCGREGSLLCSWCFSEVAQPMPSRCFRCRKITADWAVCGDCRLPLGRVWVAASHEGLLRHLIHLYKFERARDAASLLARLISEALPRLPPDTIVTYVPTATTRVRERGYDHAKDLARALSRQQGLVMASLLARLGQSRQVGATRQQRLEQVTGNYYVRTVDAVTGKKILLVDDIVTTGATLIVAARVLLEAGAQHVDATVVAQKQ